MKIKITELEKLCKEILFKRGLTKEEAEFIVEDYIDAELRNKPSHGLASFDIVANDAINKGKYQVLSDNGTVVHYDGHGDIGHIIVRDAIKRAKKNCENSGICVIGIKNFKRFATPGSVAKLGMKEGLISIVFEYGGQAFMAPYGSRESIISTNPIGIGLPSKDKTILLDMATSEKAFYYIALAKKLGQSIPEHWGINKEGESTSDPNEVFAVSPFGGYKGYALAFILEILSGIFVGVDVGLRGKISKRGALMIFLKPDLFNVDPEIFSSKINELIFDIKNSKKEKSNSEIFIPGEQGERNKNNSLKAGFIEIDQKVHSSLIELRNK